MDQIINNQAFQHIIEKIFLTLKHEDLLACELINKSSKTILDNSYFWLRKWTLHGLSEKNTLDWTKAIQLTEDTKLESKINQCIRRYLKKGILIDVPCYINENTVKSFMNTQFKIPNALEELVFRDKGTLQFTATFMKNPNAPNYSGEPPIMFAACDGNIDLIKILAPLSNNPNVPSRGGCPAFCRSFR